MPQYARPTSDIATGSWTPTPLYEQINEASYSDTDYIDCSTASYPNNCEVLLSSVSDPLSSSGHVVRYRYGRNPTNRTITLVVSLRQGADTEIAAWTHVDPALSFVLAEQTLTSTQADAITNYADLRLQFSVTASQNTQAHAQVSWAELEVPTATTRVNATAISRSVLISSTQVGAGVTATLIGGTAIVSGGFTVGSSAEIDVTDKHIDCATSVPPAGVGAGHNATAVDQIASIPSAHIGIKIPVSAIAGTAEVPGVAAGGGTEPAATNGVVVIPAGLVGAGLTATAIDCVASVATDFEVGSSVEVDATDKSINAPAAVQAAQVGAEIAVEPVGCVAGVEGAGIGAGVTTEAISGVTGVQPAGVGIGTTVTQIDSMATVASAQVGSGLTATGVNATTQIPAPTAREASAGTQAEPDAVACIASVSAAGAGTKITLSAVIGQASVPETPEIKYGARIEPLAITLLPEIEYEVGLSAGAGPDTLGSATALPGTTLKFSGRIAATAGVACIASLSVPACGGGTSAETLAPPVDMPTPTPSGGAGVGPDPVTGAVAFGEATLPQEGKAQPDAIARTAIFGGAISYWGTRAEPNTVGSTAVFPEASVQCANKSEPGTIATTTAIPGVSIRAGNRLEPASIGCVVVAPTPYPREKPEGETVFVGPIGIIISFIRVEIGARTYTNTLATQTDIPHPTYALGGRTEPESVSGLVGTAPPALGGGAGPTAAAHITSIAPIVITAGASPNTLSCYIYITTIGLGGGAKVIALATEVNVPTPIAHEPAALGQVLPDTLTLVAKFLPGNFEHSATCCLASLLATLVVPEPFVSTAMAAISAAPIPIPTEISAPVIRIGIAPDIVEFVAYVVREWDIIASIERECEFSTTVQVLSLPVSIATTHETPAYIERAAVFIEDS